MYQKEYVKGCNHLQIMEALQRLTPTCPDCDTKRMYLCVEKCCIGQPPICIECEGVQHSLHRKNELRLLFVEQKLVNNSACIVRKVAPELTEFFQLQIEACQMIIREQQSLMHAYQLALKDIESLVERLQKSYWHDELYGIMENYLGRKISAETARQGLAAKLKQINLHEEMLSSLKGIDYVKRLLREVQLSVLRTNENVRYKKALETIARLANTRSSLEELIRNTPVEHYVSVTESSCIESCLVHPSIHRSGEVNIFGLSHYTGKRMLLRGQSRYAYQNLYDKPINIANVLSLEELHTPYQLQTFPWGLKSLTYCLDRTIKVKDRQFASKLPHTLRKLRLKMSPSADIVRCLPDLPHLKYLVVVLDHTATPAYQLKLVRYAIRLNLRVLCLMTQQSTLRYCQPISNWNHRLETINEHLDPRLKNSYLSYKRRMLQVMVLHRTQLRFNYFRESIIEAAGSSFEI